MTCIDRERSVFSAMPYVQRRVYRGLDGPSSENEQSGHPGTTRGNLCAFDGLGTAVNEQPSLTDESPPRGGFILLENLMATLRIKL